MNKHDSERVAGILEALGSEAVPTIEEADIVVFLTCCVRESAETKLYGNVNAIKNYPLRPHSPFTKRLIALGGCIGQRDGVEVMDRLPHVDVVFGTESIHSLPTLLEEAMNEHISCSETGSDGNRFSTDLPSKRESPWSAWLPITVGCDNYCTYCIVPYVRGHERSRTLEDVTTEAQRLVDEGVQEITLLGQNVNSYGRDLYGQPAFADVLRRIDETGIPRLRFATSHPKDLTDEVIGLFGELESLMPYLHLPFQSGSNRVLERMNRHYTREHYMGLIHKLKDACPGIALSTDVIVGFPGETEEDFLDTYDLIDTVGFNQVFTFIYSPRSGTPAASFPESVPRSVAQDRFDRLVDLVQRKAFEANQVDRDTVIPILVEGVSKKDPHRLVGKSPKNQNVHAPIPQGRSAEDLMGEFLNVRIDDAKTWYLSGEIID